MVRGMWMLFPLTSNTHLGSSNGLVDVESIGRTTRPADELGCYAPRSYRPTVCLIDAHDYRADACKGERGRNGLPRLALAEDLMAYLLERVSSMRPSRGIESDDGRTP